MDLEELLSESELTEIIVRDLTLPPIIPPYLAESDARAVLMIMKTAKEVTRKRLGARSIDELGEQVAAAPVPQLFNESRRDPSIWASLKGEFHSLLCTSDSKYDDLRKTIGLAAGRSQTAIVSMISAAVAVNIGMVAGALIPLCALCLLAVSKMGKNVFCDRLALSALVIANSLTTKQGRKTSKKKLGGPARQPKRS